MNFLQFLNIPGFIAAGLYYAFTHILGTQEGTAVFSQAAPVLVSAIESSLAPHLGSAGAQLAQSQVSQSSGAVSTSPSQTQSAATTETSNASTGSTSA